MIPRTHLPSIIFGLGLFALAAAVVVVSISTATGWCDEGEKTAKCLRDWLSPAANILAVIVASVAAYFALGSYRGTKRQADAALAIQLADRISHLSALQAAINEFWLPLDFLMNSAARANRICHFNPDYKQLSNAVEPLGNSIRSLLPNITTFIDLFEHSRTHFEDYKTFNHYKSKIHNIMMKLYWLEIQIVSMTTAVDYSSFDSKSVREAIDDLLTSEDDAHSIQDARKQLSATIFALRQRHSELTNAD